MTIYRTNQISAHDFKKGNATNAIRNIALLKIMSTNAAIWSILSSRSKDYLLVQIIWFCKYILYYYLIANYVFTTNSSSSITFIYHFIQEKYTFI